MFGNRRLYVLLYGSPSLAVVDTERNELVGSIPVGRGSLWGQPHETPCGKLYIANAESNDVTVIDDTTERVLATLPVGRRPERNAIFREVQAVYTANVADDSVTAISIPDDTVIATVPVGRTPFRLVGMQKKTGRPELWVLNRGSDQQPQGEIAAVSGTEHRVVYTVPTVDRPANWLFEGAIGYVVSATSRDMAIVDAQAKAVVGSARLSQDPDPTSFSNMVFGPSDNLFVANANETVSMFTPA